jgi:Fe-S oxidoreductase
MLAALRPEERARSLVLVQDAFTSWYEPRVVLAVLDLIQVIGFKPFIAPFRPNGKPLHVHGFLGAFARAASHNASMMRDLAASGVELVGVDASMTLTYRSEYGMLPEADRPPPVLLLQEWLARRCDAIPKKSSAHDEYLLLPHCSERSLALSSLRDWQAAFAAVGASLRILPSGCCGMAGTYGHEAEHRATSEQIYRNELGTPCCRMGAERPPARDRLFLPIRRSNHGCSPCSIRQALLACLRGAESVGVREHRQARRFELGASSVPGTAFGDEKTFRPGPRRQD